MTSYQRGYLSQAAFFAGALIYLTSLLYSPYDYQWLVKSLPIILLAVYSWRLLTNSVKWLMTIAFMFSAVGDIFLAPSEFSNFVIGLAAFLVAQLIYCVVFFQHVDVKSRCLFEKLIAVFIPLYAVTMAMYLLPDTGELAVPVFVYLMVITAMGLLAMLSNVHWIVKVGALTFICSDSILAISLFKTAIYGSDFWIMLTYYCAQCFLLLGVVRSKNAIVAS